MPSPWSLRPTPVPLREQYLAEGFWTDESLGVAIDRHLTVLADAPFRVWSDTRPYESTIGTLHDEARRVAGGLAASGVSPGDVVAFQLPNCPEAAAVFWGVAMLGAVLVPIVHFYGPKEVGYILRESGARVVVTADATGHLDHLANLDHLRPDLPELETVVVVPLAEPALRFDGLPTAAPLPEIVPVDPDRPALIAYTSGTTADPKGVIHTHRTITAEVRQLRHIQPDDRRPLLVGAPVGHAIGMLAGLLLPLELGDPIHLTDGWDPRLVLDTVLAADINAGSGATFFLTSLLDSPAITDEHIQRMHYIGLGGSSVPSALTDRATSLGISIVRSYGSTEHPSTTGATHDDPLERRGYTDGRAMPGVEVIITDDDGVVLPAGTPGEIRSRGPDLCAGYTDPSLTAAAFTGDGWYLTGDIGVLDDDGWLTITDRKKDIIIRGGENISAAEVEDMLLRMPGIVEAAVVAAPDERLGEHACAFVRVAPGAPSSNDPSSNDPSSNDPSLDEISLDEVRAHLAAEGLARQKWPQQLHVVDDLPRTPSGKVKKYELRAHLT